MSDTKSFALALLKVHMYIDHIDLINNLKYVVFLLIQTLKKTPTRMAKTNLDNNSNLTIAQMCWVVLTMPFKAPQAFAHSQCNRCCFLNTRGSSAPPSQLQAGISAVCIQAYEDAVFLFRNCLTMKRKPHFIINKDKSLATVENCPSVWMVSSGGRWFLDLMCA